MYIILPVNLLNMVNRVILQNLRIQTVKKFKYHNYKIIAFVYSAV